MAEKTFMPVETLIEEAVPESEYADGDHPGWFSGRWNPESQELLLKYAADEDSDPAHRSTEHTFRYGPQDRDAAKSLGEVLHTVHFDLDDETVTVRLECHGDKTASCHEVDCTECDECCYCDDPTPGQVNCCVPLTWITESDAAHYSYAGGSIRNVKDGSEVTFHWDGNNWLWRLAAQSLAAVAEPVLDLVASPAS